MLPARLAPILFAVILTGLMSFIVSGVSTFRAVGLPDDFLSIWLTAWLPSWAVAFPAVLVAQPVARAVVARLVRAP